VSAEDWTEVERRLAEISDTQSQISFLKRLEIEFQDLAMRRHSAMLRAHPEEQRRDNNVTADFLERRRRFELWITLKLTRLKSIREIEREEEEERARRAKKATSDGEGIETDLSSGKWTNEQAAESGMLPNTGGFAEEFGHVVGQFCKKNRGVG
jgi:hypothetical protein